MKKINIFFVYIMNLPTKITVTRLALIPIIIISYCLEAYFNWMFIVTASLFLIASGTDFIDGYLARKYKMVTTLGKFLDPIADKILVVTGLIIAVSSDSYRLNIENFMLVSTIVIIAREFIISLFRMIAASKNIVLAADKLGKYKTMSTMVGLNALLFVPFRTSYSVIAGDIMWWISIISMPIAVILTVVSGINYIKKNSEVLKENKSKMEMFTDQEIEFPDDRLIDVIKYCKESGKVDYQDVQRNLKIPANVTFKILFWIEMMGFSSIENNVKVINASEEDIKIIEQKMIEFHKRTKDVEDK